MIVYRTYLLIYLFIESWFVLLKNCRNSASHSPAFFSCRWRFCSKYKTNIFVNNIQAVRVNVLLKSSSPCHNHLRISTMAHQHNNRSDPLRSCCDLKWWHLNELYQFLWCKLINDGKLVFFTLTQQTVKSPMQHRNSENNFLYSLCYTSNNVQSD